MTTACREYIPHKNGEHLAAGIASWSGKWVYLASGMYRKELTNLPLDPGCLSMVTWSPSTALSLPSTTANFVVSTR